jgi:hypothetical protein
LFNIIGGVFVADEINKKVINLFSGHNRNNLSTEAREQIKYFAGFNYVKLKKDENGKKFRKHYLLKYCSELRYMVTVMREEADGEIVLYSYDVPNEDLFKFMKSFDKNTLNGTIIEISKYFPNEIV